MVLIRELHLVEILLRSLIDLADLHLKRKRFVTALRLQAGCLVRNVPCTLLRLCWIAYRLRHTRLLLFF